MKRLYQHGRTSGNRGSRVLADRDGEICGYRDVNDSLGTVVCPISPRFVKDKCFIPYSCADHLSGVALCRILVCESNQYFRITIDPLIELSACHRILPEEAGLRRAIFAHNASYDAAIK